MKKRSWWIALPVLLLGFLPTNLSASDSMFTSKWEIYKAPIDVSEHYALLDYGEEAVFEFAYGERESKKWIYACESSLDFDAKTRKFSLKKKSGEDEFVRFFENIQANIIVDWFPLMDGTLKKRFEVLTQSAKDVYKQEGRPLQREGSIMEDKIGGYPAMGAKYKVDKGKKGYLTIWWVRAEKIKRDFAIRFFYAKGFADPANGFKKFKEGIVFLNP